MQDGVNNKCINTAAAGPQGKKYTTGVQVTVCDTPLKIYPQDQKCVNNDGLKLCANYDIPLFENFHEKIRIKMTSDISWRNVCVLYTFLCDIVIAFTNFIENSNEITGSFQFISSLRKFTKISGKFSNEGLL